MIHLFVEPFVEPFVTKHVRRSELVPCLSVPVVLALVFPSYAWPRPPISQEDLSDWPSLILLSRGLSHCLSDGLTVFENTSTGGSD